MMNKQQIFAKALAFNSEQVQRGEGKNIITPPKKRSLWWQYIEKFKDPIIIVLLVVFVLSVGISLYEIIWMGKGMSMLLEPCGVLVALLLATGIAFIFEVKANKEFEILNKVKDDRPVIVYRTVELVLYKQSEDLTASNIASVLSSEKVDESVDKEIDLELHEGLNVAVTASVVSPAAFAADKADIDCQPDTLTHDNVFCEKGFFGDIAKGDKAERVSIAASKGAVPQSDTSKSPVVMVVRPFKVKKQNVVVGDIVYLESGDEVPADGRLLFSNSLKVDESKFTGEVYANKSANPEDSDPDATYDSDFLLRGAMIIEGNCYYCVTAVGDDTEEGRGVALTREGSDVETPLNQQLDQLGGLISKASFIIAALILVGRTIVYFVGEGHAVEGQFDWLGFAEFMLSSVMIAVTLIVVAVPEGLPMSVTVSLALSMRKMLKANNLVRKLHACETMGATTVICTDKTGTLTKNQMVVMASDLYGEDAEDIIKLNVAVNSTAELAVESDGVTRVIGNPTEGALLKWLKGQGEDYAVLRRKVTLVSQRPFSTETKSMETVVVAEDKRTLRLIKGAPEILLEMCDTIAAGVDKGSVLQTLTAYQNKAMRTLGFAYQVVGDEDSPLIFVGVVGIADPVREDVLEAIDTCRNRAKVRVIIVTGDTPGTANEIGRQIGLLTADEAPQSVTGPQFAAMSDAEALALVADPNFKIISRARPDDKARLVTLLQQVGEVVAVTGDGTNDAPALSKAQVGLSMGDGTSRAKEASDITIIDNSFSSINKAIMWGRSLYLNIRRFIIFQMTINLCACLVVLLGAFLGLESPLTVTQMLWVNLIMDTFAAMALSSLPPDKGVLNEAPRSPKSHIINIAMMKRIVGTGLFFFVFLSALWQLLRHVSVDSVAQLLSVESIKMMFTGLFDVANTKSMSGHDLGVFFSTFVLLQFWNLFNAKYFRTNRSLILDIVDLFRNRKAVTASYSSGFIWILLIILLGQVAIVSFAGEFFNVTPLSAEDWGWLLLLTSPVLIIPDLFRLFAVKIRH
ncbi:MAG: calcium-translocating P-type ATPase, PMCA-type [Alistipes sp.]|nr:calcium-translocating P-type ATPase, PMCA-type [Alistipes sp.]